MPFNKRRKAREKAVNDLRIQAEEKFLAELEAAVDVKDPVKRILALKEVHDNIDEHRASDRSILNQEATLSSTKTRFGTLMTSGATGIAGAVLTGVGPAGWAVYGVGVAGLFGARLVGDVRGNRKLKKMLANASSHTEKMEVLKAAAMATIGETVEKNVMAVSKSSSYEAIVAMPGISEKFVAAARQHIIEEVPAVEAAAEKPRPPVKKIVLIQPK